MQTRYLQRLVFDTKMMQVWIQTLSRPLMLLVVNKQ